MKKILFFTVIIFPFLTNAQTATVSSGRITYDEKVKLELKLEGEAAAMAADFPKERTVEKILTFTGDAMLFEDGRKNVEEDMSSGHDDGNMRIRMVINGENKTFTDLKAKEVIDQRDFMNRIFLVEKDLPGFEWKITGNQKMILGYNCIEATSTDTAGVRMVAWFTPSIPVSGGPAGLGNLPGMILEADIKNGSTVYVARKIEPLDASALKIQKPREGKLVTDEEYRKIVAEKLKEMGAEEGGGGNQMRVVIRHQ